MRVAEYDSQALGIAARLARHCRVNPHGAGEMAATGIDRAELSEKVVVELVLTTRFNGLSAVNSISKNFFLSENAFSKATEVGPVDAFAVRTSGLGCDSARVRCWDVADASHRPSISTRSAGRQLRPLR